MPHTSQQGIHVLHIDDDPDFADLVKTFLKREDDRFTVETATNADEGLKRIYDRPPDCVVSDYNMPGRDGIELLRALRDEHPDLPFILFTGKGSEEVAGDALRADATDYIQKQSGSEQYELLANRIENAVSQYRSEIRLRETKEEYVTVFEGALTGLLLVDVERDGFRYQRCNPRALELIGRDREEIVGSTPSEALGTENGKKVCGAYRKCVECRESVKYSLTLDFPDGQAVRPGRVTPIELNGEITQLVVSFYDDTEAQQQREKLERQNDLFSKAQELAKVGAWEYDVQENQTSWTEQVYEIYDLSQDASIDDEAILELYHPDDRDEIREAFTNPSETVDTSDSELRLQPTDGETRWVSVRGQPQTVDGELVRIRGAIQDITGRKRRIREILELKRQYQTLSENIPNGAVFLFDENMRYERARGRELSKVGLSPNEVESTTPHDVFPTELAEELTHYFTEALNGNSNTFTQTLGESVYRNRTVPVETGDGRTAYGLALAQNVTEQVERRRELERQNERLEEFTSIVSHDLRNPLRVADGRLELLRDECKSDHIDDLAQALDRMDALIEDLLTLTREGERVDEAEQIGLTNAATNSWQTVKTERATLETDTSCAVEADRSRLRQLFENLYRNAIEHGGDNVTVSVGEMDDGFYVADTGSGIPESDREEAFEAGYSTTEGGTGFGLRIVEQVANAHGWEVTVTESEQGGARFEITGVEKGE
ncbi:response regulator [Halobellus ruber]|uniref:histidine kinase n=1 Tax=Halobellus ruber TaxID=2761102 RepID=A0A7J9SHW1_9EURY|nr:response regulator [Halobellus ruber]MBB6646308.1 response regulator [Halobellus ruber]